MKQKQGRGFKWTEKEEERLIKIYNSTKYNKLTKIFGRSIVAINKKALKLGLKRNIFIQDNRKIWSEEEELYLTNNYEFGDLNEIAHTFNRTRKAVTERAKILKITRDKELTRKNSRKNVINEDYFKSLNKDSTYVLGLICADGNVCKSSYAVSISLHKDDNDLLIDISEKMKSSYKIYFPPNKNMSVLHLESKPLHNDLVKLGIMPNKSKILKCPEISEEFFPDFIRGVFDGDGTVKVKQKRCKICSASKDFINGLSKILKSMKIEHRLYNEPYVYNGIKTDFYTVTIMRRKDVKKLYHLMYDNASLYMKRKKKAFEEMGILAPKFDDLYSCNKKAIIGTHKDTGEVIKFDSFKEANDNGFLKQMIYRMMNGRYKDYKGYTWQYA